MNSEKGSQALLTNDFKQLYDCRVRNSDHLLNRIIELAKEFRRNSEESRVV